MSKAELARAMQRILALPTGTVLNGPDREIAEAVISMHPSAAAKIGPGIDALVIRDNSFGRGHELHVIRVDGSEVDISYRRALAPQTAAAARADLIAALRQEIAGQIVRFKRDQLRSDPVCAVCGVPLAEATAHVDHVPPWTFAALADAWLEHRPTPELSLIHI